LFIEIYLKEMEIAGAKKNKHIVFIYEAIGTGMLLYAINL
jgi:hypothetical protein